MTDGRRGPNGWPTAIVKQAIMKENPPGALPRNVAFPRTRYWALGFLLVWVPSYARVWGWRNFLFLCDINVFATVLGFWRGSALLLSSQAVGGVLLNAIWTADVGARLLTGRHLLGGTEYMWDARYPLEVRLLSLFHIALPVAQLLALRKTGYDRRGIWLQMGIVGGALVLSRALGLPEKNPNFAFRDPFFNRSWGPPLAHLAVTFAAVVVGVILPTHALLSRLYRPARRS